MKLNMIMFLYTLTVLQSIAAARDELDNPAVVCAILETRAFAKTGNSGCC